VKDNAECMQKLVSSFKKPLSEDKKPTKTELEILPNDLKPTNLYASKLQV
jgi:hypothetical protein